MKKPSFLKDLAPTSHWLFGPLRDNAKIYGQTILAATIVNLLGLVSSFFIMTVYDRVLPNQAIESLIALTIGVILAHVFDFLLKSLRGYFIDIAGQRLDATVGASVFDNLMAMRLDARRGATGQIAGLVKEFDNLRDFFSSATLVAIVDLPFIFLFIGAIALVGGPIALVPLIGVLGAIISGVLIQPLIMKRTQEAMAEGHHKNAVLIETLGGLETIKSVKAEGLMRARWRSGVARHAKISAIGRFLNQFAVNASGFAQQASQVGVVVIGVFLVAGQEITTGALIASVILTGRAMAPLGQVASLLSRVSGAMASYKSLNHLMTSQSETEAGREYLARPELKGKIEFRDVNFTYPGTTTKALDEISFTIEPGERVAILGKNGSGKSTIVRQITGVYQPTEGSVLVDDTDVRQLRPADLRANIGAVLQDVCLFSGSIRENIALGLEGVSDEDILEAASIAGVHEFVGATAGGYDQRLAERGEGLSGGQRQAIALARALAPKPSILLMDEPSSSLDAQAEAALISRLEKATQGKTLLVVTHRMSMVRLVDRIIVLDKGRILVDGPRDTVMRAMASARELKTRRIGNPKLVPSSDTRAA
ncbi:type I secretion system permease/ATPase [Hyphococcus luteus]|uniref:Type I secretion system permease/ATPase n=1 Tax=Hyphococcus luteus TaxID=2058213 RepID=A0A2S7K7S9_9PROT|nr:type I secretion system permease/ATPase [Marinicaulis flavus]PQA88541.1 type I secretion system permease/ATPase [Marinicaulis flavus]